MNRDDLTRTIRDMAIKSDWQIYYNEFMYDDEEGFDFVGNVLVHRSNCHYIYVCTKLYNGESFFIIKTFDEGEDTSRSYEEFHNKSVDEYIEICKTYFEKEGLLNE